MGPNSRHRFEEKGTKKSVGSCLAITQSSFGSTQLYHHVLILGLLPRVFFLDLTTSTVNLNAGGKWRRVSNVRLPVLLGIDD
jgi:hypothetical protein